MAFELLQVDGQTGMVKLIGLFLQLFIMNALKMIPLTATYSPPALTMRSTVKNCTPNNRDIKYSIHKNIVEIALTVQSLGS